MKNTFLTVLFTIQLVNISCNQTAKETVSSAGPDVLNAKYVRLVPDTNRMMLIENVKIEFGDLHAEADSALLEKPSQTITLFGARNASFKGSKISIQDPARPIKYKKGESSFQH